LLLPELIPFYQRIGCAEISTNATLLAKKPEFLKLLRDHGIGLLFVSLHGNQQEHCRLTGVQPSVYTELLESLAYIVKSGFHLEVVTTLYKGNVGALDSLPELLIDIGVSKWWIQRIMPAGYARNWDPSEFLYSEECKEVLFKYAQLKNRFNPTQLRVGLDLTWGPNFYSQRMLKFLAGQVQDWPWTRFACPAVSENSVVISMDSKKAYPCLFFESFPEASIGEIRSDLYVETRDSPFSEEKLLNKLRGQCSECLYKAYCLGGCRAVAFSFAMLRGAEEPFYAGQDFCLTHWIEQELD
jgi:radical SAM protein with 4Fe4S-binding SPASM domain